MTPLGIAKHSHIFCLTDYLTCFHSSLHVVHLDNHTLTGMQAPCDASHNIWAPCIRHTSQASCLFADSGELADLLEMPVPDLALKLIPAALPKLTEDQNTAALETLAHSVGYGLQQMMLDYGFHVVAKYLYGGWSELSFVMPRLVCSK